jgi:hypothetical protein
VAYQSGGITLIRRLNVYDNRFDDDCLAFIRATSKPPPMTCCCRT